MLQQNNRVQLLEGVGYTIHNRHRIIIPHPCYLQVGPISSLSLYKYGKKKAQWNNISIE